MISSDTKLVLEATLPVVESALPEITPRFYDRMFTARPELLRDLFNRTNQATGGQPQVLAGAVAAFARLQLEPDAERMRFVIDRIAHKHASLGIVPEQYPIVHEHLFAAIVDVLGDAVTPEVAAAWDELYWEMADVLIGREAELYRAAGVDAGEVWQSALVTGREQVSPDAVAFTLTGVDGTPLGAFVPGQYISVQAPMADGANQIRQYSLTGATSDPAWHVSVKCDGEVSTHLHEHVFEGDVIRVSTPFGDLTLPEGDDPLLLASAGIGCTPVIGLLNHLAATGDTRPVTVLHADRSRSRQPHRGDLAQLVDRLPAAELVQWYENGLKTDASTRIGYMDLDGIDIAPDTVALLCGPSGFLGAIRDALLDRDVPGDRIHYETFGVMK
ncbi:globin domain-containing protein [Gordonia neofelifaecis]|uniref:nitric oxide dioxygenase n=1 Tax=Gordonia neofelifaecis NRRL B-59395 TaxID=644548 RepID=F1YMN1_9ACTN|nr:globin domain-containing protein [Gordonia neofelifaecis]EGD53966.1 Oxidoreductase FAD-binding domain-containing protein [Gordonia neofelifaecis NRRL B-59395]